MAGAEVERQPERRRDEDAQRHELRPAHEDDRGDGEHREPDDAERGRGRRRRRAGPTPRAAASASGDQRQPAEDERPAARDEDERRAERTEDSRKVSHGVPALTATRARAALRRGRSGTVGERGCAD